MKSDPTTSHREKPTRLTIQSNYPMTSVAVGSQTEMETNANFTARRLSYKTF